MYSLLTSKIFSNIKINEHNKNELKVVLNIWDNNCATNARV